MGEQKAAADFRCRVEVEVRYRDLDANSHVNNAVYLTYFEEARISYLRLVVEERPLTPAALGVVVAEATVRYRSPAFLGEVLEVGVRVAAMRRTSFVMEYEVRERQTGRLVATGTTVMVAFDFERNRIRALNPITRRAVELYEGRAFPSTPEPHRPSAE